ncbi:LacI family DNA-binding transcriptional regulator [Streptomyces sp. NPDC005820]|uniref:LacI family DNA-binding transcriptional regulator n=1 Tax=Streptomyces sp. NPDC005820 TaxID=3157069 RepID=UPI0033C2714A
MSRRQRHRVGVKDVAREAGVSLGTVSNVLNRPEIVADATRTRVLSVIDSPGYVRAEGARLREAASRVPAVMVTDLANPFYAALASGVEQAAREAGLNVMVCPSPRDPAELACHLALLSSHLIRGVVLSSGEGIDRTVSALRRTAIPFAVADQNAPQPGAPSGTGAGALSTPWPRPVSHRPHCGNWPAAT